MPLKLYRCRCEREDEVVVVWACTPEEAALRYLHRVADYAHRTHFEAVEHRIVTVQHKRDAHRLKVSWRVAAKVERI